MPSEATLIARIRELESELAETLQAANRWEGKYMRLSRYLEQIRYLSERIDRSIMNDAACGFLDWIERYVYDAIGVSQQQGFESRCPECGRRQISGNDHFGNCPCAKLEGR